MLHTVAEQCLAMLHKKVIINARGDILWTVRELPYQDLWTLQSPSELSCKSKIQPSPEADKHLNYHVPHFVRAKVTTNEKGGNTQDSDNSSSIAMNAWSTYIFATTYHLIPFQFILYFLLLFFKASARYICLLYCPTLVLSSSFIWYLFLMSLNVLCKALCNIYINFPCQIKSKKYLSWRKAPHRVICYITCYCWRINAWRATLCRICST